QAQEGTLFWARANPHGPAPNQKQEGAGRVLAAGDGPLRLLVRPAPPPPLQLHPSLLLRNSRYLLLLLRLRAVAHPASSVLHIRR
ncbi:unnamed protein product, partial [Urochloa humidicola]